MAFTGRTMSLSEILNMPMKWKNNDTLTLVNVSLGQILNCLQTRKKAADVNGIVAQAFLEPRAEEL
jgi:hypothetical protein